MTDGSNGTPMFMPVAPAYGAGNGMDGFGSFGGSWFIIFLLIIMMGGWNGGWGNNFGGGNGAFPWIMNGQAQGYSDVQRGFDQNAIMTGLSGIQSGMTSGFGDVQLGIAGINQNICSTGNAITGAVRDGFYGSEIAANGRAMSNMQQLFGVQTAITGVGTNTVAGLADVKYALATEGANTRAAGTANTQAILDKLCQLELDGVKSELANANNTINQLRTQLLVSNNEASQVAQTAAILAGQSAEVDALYNRLNSCPVPTTPVYGRTPIFTCGNSGCGCGMAA